MAEGAFQVPDLHHGWAPVCLSAWEQPEHAFQVHVDTIQEECGVETEMGKQDRRHQWMKAISPRDCSKMDVVG